MVVDDSNPLRRLSRIRRPVQKYAGLAQTVTWSDQDIDLAEACSAEAHPFVLPSSSDALSWEPAPKTIREILKMPEGPVWAGW
jgi:hypothetical protein